VNFIDTADVYPGGADLPEVDRADEITGLWLKGKHSRFILETKAGGRMGSSPWDQGSRAKATLAAMRIAFRLATIVRSFDIGHLHFFSSDRMATAKGNLIPRICYAVHLTILHRRD